MTPAIETINAWPVPILLQRTRRPIPRRATSARGRTALNHSEDPTATRRQPLKAQTTFSLKDQLFNKEKVHYLATLIEAVYPDFAKARFCRSVLSALPALELKERIAHITESLHRHLPPVYRDALAILLQALPPELDPTRTDDDFGDFIIAPFSLYVATYGCTKQHLKVSLQALRKITKRFSAEDATRYFISSFPDETLAFLNECARDRNYHVRRLASESTRPLLPWAQRLTINYRDPLPILDLLYRDRTRYVTRSVANHLNDISKLDPDVVISTLERWQSENGQSPSEMDFVTKHALRSLIRQGNNRALELIGVSPEPDVTVTSLETTTPRICVGESFRFSLSLHSHCQQSLMIDYVMTFAGNDRGARTKVFKLKHVKLGPGESVKLAKTHPMRLMTTRRLHPGEHVVTVRINGKPLGTLAFDLKSGRSAGGRR
jgi:3-methyladenine DNA glycosylase AlkC